jgi:hybrid polyketide synthase/nonribosomal peptide synthetase ACE1
LTNTHGFGAEIVLQQSSVGFDMSLNQIFMALANGGTLVIVPEALRKDPLAVSKILLDHNITYTSATPSEYLAWSRHGLENLSRTRSWRFATAGGEQFSPDLVQTFRNLKSGFHHPFKAINAYGPTEGSCSSNEIEVNLEGSINQHIPAGKALPNYAVYIVDGELRPMPIGFPGEICIAGAGVAIAYLNKPTETAKKFVRDPQLSTIAAEKGWVRMYRTGDKGKLLPGGSLEVLGRIEGDTQIKLRGLRIEMQDIEQSILDSAKAQVKEVIVTPRGEPTILVAHAVLSAQVSTDNQPEFLRLLAASLPLPQYMRPAAIIPVDSFPLNASGKIDRKAVQMLPIPATLSKQRTAELTRELTASEVRLVRIWEEVLPRQMQGVHTIDEASDFFHVGGNSMLLIELRELVRKTFAVHLPLLHLFEHSTLGSMAAAIQDMSASGTATELDWEKETEVPSNFKQLEGQRAVQSGGSHRTLVLTGATGFLGNAMLQILVDDATVDKVHCIAIRNSKKLAKFIGSEKVVIHQGDLSLPRCGLSEADATFVFNSADAIIHNGADVSFLKSYNTLRAPNLTSTKELVKLALPRQIPFHFISTATVGKLNKSDTLAPESLASLMPSPTFADGYAASKWASEVFLEKANTQFGLPTFIHRPSSITGAQAGETDIVSNVLKYASALKSLPDSSNWTGYVDLISLESAATGIVKVVLDDRAADVGAQGVGFLHHAGEKVIPAQSIKTHLSGDDKLKWETVTMDEWVDKAVHKGMNPLVGEFLRSADKGTGMQIGQKLLLE